MNAAWFVFPWSWYALIPPVKRWGDLSKQGQNGNTAEAVAGSGGRAHPLGPSSLPFPSPLGLKGGGTKKRGGFSDTIGANEAAGARGGGGQQRALL